MGWGWRERGRGTAATLDQEGRTEAGYTCPHSRGHQRTKMSVSYGSYKPGKKTRARTSLLGANAVAEEVRMARWQLGPRRRLPVTLSRPVILFPLLRSEGTLEAKLSLGVQSHTVP